MLVIPHRCWRWATCIVVACLVMAAAARPAWALQADQILLVTNKNDPESKKLADLYASLRGVPPDQLVQLDLPNAEEMPFAVYETNVVAPLRQYLIEHQLKGQVTCLLTFYGVPFRVAAKTNTDAEQKELAELLRNRTELMAQAGPIVAEVEKQAMEMDPSFRPESGNPDSAQTMQIRTQTAARAVLKNLPSLGDLAVQVQAMGRLMSKLEKLGGRAELDGRIGQQQRDMPGKSPEDRAQWQKLHEQVLMDAMRIGQLRVLRWDAGARAEMRQMSLDAFGLLGALHVLEAQSAYFQTDRTAAATDSELALLWWDYYPRSNWQINPLNCHVHAQTPPVLMTMRLDGPDPATVEKMMRTSVDVEKTGLQGIAAVDARGLPPTDEYGLFDERLRNMVALIRTKTELKLRVDDREALFPPHSVKGVALYCGWHSPGQYVPGCDFNPGAVGFHVASFEMVTLHAPTGGWVRGLLSDGVVATLGPVAEPYLTAFPKPDEFFALLLTGKLTLAEVYWKTTPMTSWLIACIGDPLYTPYKAHPALKVADLPAPLRAAVGAAASEPTTGPQPPAVGPVDSSPPRN
ncbi:MAG: TIGR03790 family protein [Tepidisphaeraceae bacterium]